MIELTENGDAVLLPVKVVPGASRTRYLGEWQGRARIAVAAPAERGRANAAVAAFVADWFGVRRARVAIASGRGSPQKVVRIEGIRPDAVRAML